MSKEEANELSVRLELQADFLAGVWAHHAQKTRQILEPGDVESGLARRIGDRRRPPSARNPGLRRSRLVHPRHVEAAGSLVPERPGDRRHRTRAIPSTLATCNATESFLGDRTRHSTPELLEPASNSQGDRICPNRESTRGPDRHLQRPHPKGPGSISQFPQEGTGRGNLHRGRVVGSRRRECAQDIRNGPGGGSRIGQPAGDGHRPRRQVSRRKDRSGSRAARELFQAGVQARADRELFCPRCSS